MHSFVWINHIASPTVPVCIGVHPTRVTKQFKINCPTALVSSSILSRNDGRLAEPDLIPKRQSEQPTLSVLLCVPQEAGWGTRLKCLVSAWGICKGVNLINGQVLHVYRGEWISFTVCGCCTISHALISNLSPTLLLVCDVGVLHTVYLCWLVAFGKMLSI